MPNTWPQRKPIFLQMCLKPFGSKKLKFKCFWFCSWWWYLNCFKCVRKTVFVTLMWCCIFDIREKPAVRNRPIYWYGRTFCVWNMNLSQTPIANRFNLTKSHLYGQSISVSLAKLVYKHWQFCLDSVSPCQILFYSLFEELLRITQTKCITLNQDEWISSHASNPMNYCILDCWWTSLKSHICINSLYALIKYAFKRWKCDLLLFLLLLLLLLSMPE